VTSTRTTWLLAVLWAILYTALAFLLSWSRNDETGRLIAAAALTIVAGVLTHRLRNRIAVRGHVAGVLLLLAVGCVVASWFAWRLHRLGTEWEQLQSERTARVQQALDRRMKLVIEHGRRVATQAAGLPADTSRRQTFDRLADLQRRSKVDALILFGEQGELRAWAGEHRGRLPDTVRTATAPVSFVERPLYSYLYFAAARPNNTGNAVVAILLDAALPSGAQLPGLAAQVEALTGRDATFLEGPGLPADWNLVVSGDTLLHARLDPLTQTEWRRELLRMVQRFQLALAFVALVLLAGGWFRDPVRPRWGAAIVPFCGMTAAALAAPLGSALGLQIFSPGLFLFPGPGDISLGSLLAILLVSGTFVSTWRLRGRGSPFWFPVAALALALGLPIVIMLLIGPTPEGLETLQAWTSTLLQGGAALWIGLQLAVVLLVAILTVPVLGLARLPARVPLHQRHPASYVLLSTSLVLASMFALIIAGLARTRIQLSPWLAVLWFLPVLLAGTGIAAYQREGRGLVRWLMAGWLAGTALLPFVWIAHVSERLTLAERELATLGSRYDPFLDYLLRQFSSEAIARRERGEDGLLLLYRSWVSSGMAREAYPARITIWGKDGMAEVQLPLGDAITAPAQPLESVPAYLSETFARVHELAQPEVFTAHNVEDVNQVMVVPLDSGRMVTVEVPPRRSLERASVIAPFLGATVDPGTSLELVAKRTAASGGIWHVTQHGWRSEAVAHFGAVEYHAHLDLRLPSVGVQAARGVLILTADLVLMLLLWLGGLAMRNEPVVPRGGWFGWLASLRGRITAALFGFFLLPTVTFGWVAYGALALEVTRAARTVAERAVSRAVLEFPEQEDLRRLASRTGNELLWYLQGEVQTGSSPEALELGVYSAFIPPEIFLAIESGEVEMGAAPRRIGNQEFITAYRRLQLTGTGILAVPASLQSGETVLRQHEMRDLILFAALVGALLSLALSLAVGRALAGPIGRLQRAAATVGAGRLRVQLPEKTGDEFGDLYASFNRMVRRLQRARTQEVRTARVLAWGEMARQVAHEIKNPLTPIKLSVQHLKRAYGDRRGDFDQVLDENVDQILVEIDRLSEIARAFSRYGAPPESAGPLEPVDVASVVHEALTLYRAGDPTLHYDDWIEPGLPRVLSRAGELKEVILNLLENARAATTPPGRIAVTARVNGAAVELCVEDTGAGIPANMLARIFEPHFSTRTTGTGLGLPIVRRLVESWGGSVLAESETGRGTVIRVRLLPVNRPGT
jgi:signal transduction histidine kinase